MSAIDPEAAIRSCLRFCHKFSYESVLVDPLSGIYSPHLGKAGRKVAIRVSEQRGILVKRISEMNLDKIEEAQADGLTSRQILDIFEAHGISLSEATLRKYVQLGLLPRSVRVGSKGKHQGSKGMYP